MQQCSSDEVKNALHNAEVDIRFQRYGDLESRSDESNPAKIQAAGETWIGNYAKGYEAGYEAIHMIRKGQACWSAASAKVGLLHQFILGLLAARS